MGSIKRRTAIKASVVSNDSGVATTVSLPVVSNLGIRCGRSMCFWEVSISLLYGLSLLTGMGMFVAVRPGACTETAQGWPKLWANFRARIGIFSQTVGPSLAIWANPVQFSL